MGPLSSRRLLPYAGLIFAGCVLGTFSRAPAPFPWPRPTR